ncbi:hypothetical protein [Pseudactinotalea sp.]|uniref:hypothetical protein n=1 Tax=Pseudactinotalea sp. TaxID=1926260 RepID=UPI003B3A54DD
MNASERRAAYLDDLGGLLRPLTALQRIEVIDGVRERIDSAVADLGREPTDGDMATILESIGSVEEVADRAVPRPAPATTQTEVAAPSGTSDSATTTRPRVFDNKPAPKPVRNFDLSSIPAMDWPEEQPPRPSMTRRWLPFVVLLLMALGGFFLMFLLPALALIVGAILLWISPLWTTTQKAIGTVAAAVGLGAFLPLLALGAGTDGNPVLAMMGFVLVILGIAVLVWVGIRGVRASREVDAQHPQEPKKKR